MEPTVNDPSLTATPDSGAATPSSTDGGASTDPGAAGGTTSPQPDPRDEQIRELRANVKALNQAVVDGRRTGRQPGNANDGGTSFDTPEGKYAAALEIADSRLRGSIEKIIPLYPEVPADEIARVRSNPWAFVSRDTMLSGDYEAAKYEIEQALLDRADAIAAAKGASVTPAPTPANLSNNPAPDTAGQTADPGTKEDQDPWTMPMEELEKVAMREKAKLSTTSK